ncbi:hypothetical protein [Streptomyces sp. NPDC058657]|uniref:hypothetical protein n=1 Tax=unclassified Streptomyces TaxID=2593676 RepID=UPI00365415B5
MPAPNRRAATEAALPQAHAAVAFLRAEGQEDLADAVTVVTEYAADSAARQTRKAETNSHSAPSFTIAGTASDVQRVKSLSPNVTSDVIEGFERFLAGEWEPAQPERSRRHSGQAREAITIRVPADLVDRVNERAAHYATEHNFRTGRGYDLHARSIALQWLIRKYPEPTTT